MNESKERLLAGAKELFLAETNPRIQQLLPNYLKRFG